MRTHEKTPPGDGPETGQNKKFNYNYNGSNAGSCQSLMDYALDALQSGLSVIPSDPATKKQTLDRWKPYQKAPMSQQAAAGLNWPGLAIITGKVSGHLEILDFDFKAEWFNVWAEIVEAEAPRLIARLTRESTQSGGKHIAYRCPGVAIPGNQKLASGKIEVEGPGDHEFKGKKHAAHQEDNKWFIAPCYIETRGEGGYFLADPTPGYALESGSFLELPEITPAERETLIRAAAALNRYVKSKYHRQPTIDGDRPGDIYNQEADPRPLLEKHGWTPAGSRGEFEHYTRPGKEKGVSASLIDSKLFHVFTSNYPPLEQWTAYTPFALYATFEHGGDFESAARSLWRQGYQSQQARPGDSQAVDQEPKPKQNEAEKKAWAYARQLIPRTLYPWEILPEEITESLKKLARACATTAAPLPGFACAMIGATVGRKVNISPKPAWDEPIIIWPIDVKSTGEGKTAPMRAMAGVFFQEQRKVQELADQQQAEWEATPKKDRGEPPPRAQGYYVTDLTLEGLRAELEKHPTGGIIAILNEASALINTQNQYKQKGTDRESMLKLHDGDDVRVVRAKQSLLIRNARFQAVGGIQPAIFKKVFGGDDGQYLSDGTVYRCLFTYDPAAHHPLTLESWDNVHRQAWENTLKNAMQWADMVEQPHTIRLDEEAQNLFLNWRNELDREKINLPPEIRGFLPKAYGYALRLAAAIDLIHQFNAGDRPRQVLDKTGMERGIQAAMFYLGQAVDIIRLILGDEMAVDPVKARILEALQDRGELTATAIYKEVFHRNRSSEEIQKALSELAESGQIETATERTKGRPKKTYKPASKRSKTSKSSEGKALNDLNDLFEPGFDFENTNSDEVEI